MKNTIITVIFSILTVIASPISAAPNQAPADLEKLRESGLSDKTLSRFLAQNLAERVAPPVDSKFLSRLAQYGGDHLAKTYLDLDKISAREKKPQLSQAEINSLINARTPPAEIQMIISEEISRYENAKKSAASLMPPSLPPLALADVGGNAVEASSRQAEVLETRPEVAIPVGTPHMARLAPPADPQIMVSPKLPEAARPPAGFQDLRPGQAADPASNQPLPYSTYDIRNNRQGGDIRLHKAEAAWMGVAEKELPDGHVVEANSIGQSSLVGQEVYSRPSGHKVYRYYTGKPDEPSSGADKRQEAINRDKLKIIYQNRQADRY